MAIVGGIGRQPHGTTAGGLLDPDVEVALTRPIRRVGNDTAVGTEARLGGEPKIRRQACELYCRRSSGWRALAPPVNGKQEGDGRGQNGGYLPHPETAVARDTRIAVRRSRI